MTVVQRSEPLTLMKTMPTLHTTMLRTTNVDYTFYYDAVSYIDIKTLLSPKRIIVKHQSIRHF